ncbi:MAG: hypothetical protein ACOYMA_04665 [Bacteroidia bacterium]
MKKLYTIQNWISICTIMILFLMVSSCTKEESKNNNTSSISSNPNGIWQRYGSPKGYQTDLAVGNIPGESSNRVYMCEHPGSSSAGLYKGYISGNIITWDSKYGLPNAEFKPVGNEMTLYFGVGLVSDAGKYKKGNWTNTCGDLSGSGSTSNGSIVFWVGSDLGCGTVKVNLNGSTGNISSYYSSSPSCGASGCANFTLPPGSYSYSASCGSYTWSGTVNATSNGCYKLQLTL